MASVQDTSPHEDKSAMLNNERAQSQAIFPFLDLPADIRVMIYSFAVPWPTFTELPHSAECTLSPEFEDNTNGYKGQAPCYDDRRLWPPKLQCPTILLICRQITDEVFEELDRSPLIFDEPPPHLLHYEFEPLDRIPHRYCLTNYLSPDRLCTARRIEILVKPSIVPNPCPSPQLVANPQMLYRRLYDSWSCFVDYLLYIWRRKTPLLEHLTLRLRVSATPNSRSRQDLIKRLASVLRMLKPECEIKIEVDDPELEWQLRAKTGGRKASSDAQSSYAIDRPCV